MSLIYPNTEGGLRSRIAALHLKPRSSSHTLGGVRTIVPVGWVCDMDDICSVAVASQCVQSVILHELHTLLLAAGYREHYCTSLGKEAQREGKQAMCSWAQRCTYVTRLSMGNSHRVLDRVTKPDARSAW